MNYLSAKKYIIDEISSIYGHREAENIAMILIEDMFSGSLAISTELLSQEHEEILLNAIKDLKNHKPLQYITGITDFYGYKFFVNKDVLIPRPETEELVYKVLEDNNATTGLNVLDIGTGSGCIPISLALNRPSWKIYGLDTSIAALEVAQYNAKKHKVKIQYMNQDVLLINDSLDIPELDIIISNPPYIPHDEKGLMSANVLEYEPYLALFVQGKDALLFYRKIISLGEKLLKPNGKIYFECNEYNASALLEIVDNNEFYSNPLLFKDLQGKDRILVLNKISIDSK